MKRGPYAKTREKREEILETALTVIARDGYSRATVRELAEELGMSTTGLMHHFGSKESLLTEVLRRRDAMDSLDDAGASLLAPTEDSLATGLTAVIRHNAEVPGLVQLYTRLSAEASEATHSSHEYFRDRYDRIRREYASAIEREQRHGRITRSIDADTLAIALVAVLDGLQTQWMFDPDIDMAAVVSTVLSALGEQPTA